MRRTRLMRAAVAICPALILATCTAREDCAAGNPLMPICFDPRPPEPQVVFMKAWDSTWTRSDIYTMNSDGTNERRLTTDGMRSNGMSPGQAAWSPDGRQIAFHRRSDTSWVRSQIFVIGADGTGLRNLSNQTAAFDYAPSWSPDGRRIVFHSDRHNPTKTQSCCVTSIYVMDADGSNVQRLTTDGNDRFPHWSPDGSTIAFCSSRGGGVMQIFLMNADGSNVRQLTTEGSSRQPRWSPDGSRIAFESTRNQATGGMGNGIYVMNADGSDQMIVGQGLGFMNPTWSSDGREVFFSAMAGWNPHMRVYAVPMEGGALRQVSDNSSENCCTDFKQPRRPGGIR